MIVRIRFDLGRKKSARPRSDRRIALAAAALLSPAALVAFVLGAWSLSADLGWAGEFGIRNGVFARWQTWFLISLGLQAVALILNRYGNDEGQASIP